jgi:CheY-like chemotaxis protein
MDVNMPRMQGDKATQLYREWMVDQQRAGRRAGPRCLIFAMTGNTSPEDEQHLRDCGVDDYLSKPFTPALISAVLSRHFGEAEKV